mmetsp:Transcript_35833/g.101423  ORF Transcript_35833/g.101423 Transcript_35833/m.101423 type:complete len:215 (+) Transcript_35833:547-1191(+)
MKVGMVAVTAREAAPGASAAIVGCCTAARAAMQQAMPPKEASSIGLRPMESVRRSARRVPARLKRPTATVPAHWDTPLLSNMVAAKYMTALEPLSACRTARPVHMFKDLRCSGSSRSAHASALPGSCGLLLPPPAARDCSTWTHLPASAWLIPCTETSTCSASAALPWRANQDGLSGAAPDISPRTRTRHGTTDAVKAWRHQPALPPCMAPAMT